MLLVHAVLLTLWVSFWQRDLFYQKNRFEVPLFLHLKILRVEHFQNVMQRSIRD